MLERQHKYAALAINAGVSAGTDVTGFGLAGHLLEMLEASQVSAILELDEIPTLPGASEAVSAGIQSSLAPSNRMAAASVQANATHRQQPSFDLLFDPQTCGGLLLGVSDAHLPELNATIETTDLRPLVRIGTGASPSEQDRLITVK